ncbi:HupE/UreJ family protein [Lysobacter koreensis]|uniref:HupE/UreJ family protein n=1 Tax=Lysobacter koreensis TaxID=266122 RepID=A0ABW2YHN3_9GAMM
MNRRGACAAPLAAGLALLAWLAVAAPARAHTLSVAHLDIQVPDDAAPIRVELDLALRDIALSLPLDANRDERITWGELRALHGELEPWARSGLALSTRSGACTLHPAGLATRRYDDGAYATLQWTARCPDAGAPKVAYRLLMDRDPQHRALLTVRRGERVSASVLRASDRGAPANGRDAAAALAARTVSEGSRGQVFADFLREGVHHILIGYDHLAFLLCLLLPAALLRRGDHWQPAPGLRSGFVHVLGIVTAFTLAHSVTLTLAALGWVTPAGRVVEAAIAASVLLAALNNVWPVVTRRLWLVGFGFGLVHGFGFAGALGELGLPDGARLRALLGFNLGVELGQLAVVALLLPLLFALRRHGWYSRWVLPGLSLAVAGLAGWWLWQRLG